MAGTQKNDVVVKIMIVTGSFPPAKCGVGEYAHSLAQALAAKSSNRVGILTSSNAGSENGETPGVEVFRVVPTWTLDQLIPTLRMISKFGPDIAHIHYPTQGYDGRLAKALPLFLRMQGIPVVQTWHEHYSQCVALGWPNVLACDALIHVRPDLPCKLPGWVRGVMGHAPMAFIPSGSTVPIVELDPSRLERVKRELSPDRPIVCFFGFANPNKGVERVFRVADPGLHHLVLLCDLDPANPYHATILKTSREEPWAGHVTVTGFQPAHRVAECLAVADAALFPFPNGAGEWNTSLKAAEASGVFSVATTDDRARHGYHAAQNVFFCGRDALAEMRAALARYLGHRIAPQTVSPWSQIALTHERVYRVVCGEGSAG